MINIDALDPEILVGGLVAIVVVMASAIWYLSRKEKERADEESKVTAETDEDVAVEETVKGKVKKSQIDKRKKDAGYDHPWNLTTLKGHSASITGFDFAQSGKRLISVSVDRSALIWNVSDFTEKEHKMTRQVLDFDTASKVAFAPDCRSVICSMKRDNKIGVFKLVRKEDGGSFKLVRAENVDFPCCHKLDISALGIASTGKYLMTASPDMKIVLYNIRGEVLTTLEPKVSSLFDCTISPDGRFVAICGFTSEVFIYEPKFNREGEFQDCKKVFILGGHTSGVFGVAFNQDCSRAITVSRDGFWRVFDTDIRYAQGQDASELRRGEWSGLKNATPDRIKMAISPSGGSIAVSCGTTLKMFSSEDETMNYPELTEVHSSVIECIRFSPCGKWVATTGDKCIRLFHNVPEHHSVIVRLQRSLPEVTADASRRRIQEQIEDAKKQLQQFDM